MTKRLNTGEMKEKLAAKPDLEAELKQLEGLTGTFETCDKTFIGPLRDGLEKHLLAIGGPALAKCFLDKKEVAAFGSALLHALPLSRDVAPNGLDLMVHSEDLDQVLSPYLDLCFKDPGHFKKPVPMSKAPLVGCTSWLLLDTPVWPIHLLVVKDDVSFEQVLSKSGTGPWAQAWFDFRVLTFLHIDAYRDRICTIDSGALHIETIAHLQAWARRGFRVKRATHVPYAVSVSGDRSALPCPVHLWLANGDEYVVHAGSTQLPELAIDLAKTCL